MITIYWRVFCVLAAVQAGAMAQSGWTQVAATGPGGRYDHAMAYDSQRGRTVLFGGYGSHGSSGDTWEWDGTRWYQAATTGPSDRRGHAMAYDSRRGRVVLFGGSAANDTWEWNGASWAQAATTGPPARYDTAMAYDSRRGRVVLFGGSPNGTLGMLADTWEWDGTNWLPQLFASGPTARLGHAMAYDSQRGKTVLFGGFFVADDTWEWDGTSWTRMSGQGPLGRFLHAMTGHSQRTVIFGGTSNNMYLGDTWEWDGASWTPLAIAQPSARENAAMVYDSQRQRTVLFGGFYYSGPNQPVYHNDTWELLAPPPIPATFSTVGTGCAGSGGTPTLGAASGDLPRIGTAFDMRLSSLPAVAVVVGIVGFSTTQNNSARGSFPLPANLSSFGMSGCTQYVSDDFTFFMLGLAGQLNWSVSIPANSGLAGVRFNVQGVVFDPGSNAFGATVTNAGTAQIGS